MSHVTVIRPDIRHRVHSTVSESLTKMTADGGSADSAVSPGLAADSTSRLGYCSLQTPGDQWELGSG